MRRFLKSFSIFLYSPSVNFKGEKSIISLANGLFIYLFFLIITSYVLMYLDRWVGIPPNKIHSIIAEQPIWKTLLIATIIVPILEETAFRLPLYFNKENLSLSIVVMTNITLKLFTKGLELTPLWDKTFYYGVPVLIGILTYLLLSNSTPLQDRLKAFWAKNFTFIFYFLALFFSLIHVTNLEVEYNTDYLVFFPLCFPQFIIGLISSYFRCTYSFWHGVLFHSLVNGIVVSIAFMALQ